MLTKQQATPRPRPRRGLILLIVLIVVTMVALVGFGFVASMLSENKGVHVRGEHLQLEHCLLSGEEYIKSVLRRPEVSSTTAEGSASVGEVEPAESVTSRSPLSMLDDPTDFFRGRDLWKQGEEQPDYGFTILSLNDDGGGERTFAERPTYQYGLQNESKKLNLASLAAWDAAQPGSGREALLKLPQMTEEIADALLDWIDPDQVSRSQGSEQEYYAGLNPPLTPRDGPPESLEELLLVKGITRELLFGKDRNDNGQIDEQEKQETTTPQQDETSTVPRGWSQYLTLYSREGHHHRGPKPPIPLNDPDMTKLRAALAETSLPSIPPGWHDFVIYYRQYGPSPLPPATAPPPATLTPDLARPPQFPIRSIYDLIDVRVEIPAANGVPAIVLNSPFTAEREAMQSYLPKAIEQLATDVRPVRIGRINLLAASKTVLSMIPGLTIEQVDRIVSGRATVLNEQGETPPPIAWLYWQGIVDLPTLRKLVPYTTCGGDVYSAQIIGYSRTTKRVQRAEVLIDASGPSPRRLYWKDLQLLGPGFSWGVIVPENANGLGDL